MLDNMHFPLSLSPRGLCICTAENLVSRLVLTRLMTNAALPPLLQMIAPVGEPPESAYLSAIQFVGFKSGLLDPDSKNTF
jgi:hypothetical protein